MADNRRFFIFLDEEKGEELTLPVTPENYVIDHGINSEKLNLTELGQVNVPGKRYMMELQLECMFPAQRYSFVNEGAVIDPYYYVRKFEDWCDEGKILRFMIGADTNINTTCFINKINFTERDGTHDVYATIGVSQYRRLSAGGEEQKQTGNNPRPQPQETKEERSYTISAGDTLSGICRKFYGDPSLYGKVAAYNDIPNPHLIPVGKTLHLPDRTMLS